MDTSPKKLLLGHPLKLQGFFTLDYVGSPDRNFDLNEPLDYQYNSIETIESHHVIEHLHPGRVKFLVTSWVNCLKPGGTLIIETPDFDQLITWYIRDPDNKKVLQWIFGDDSRKGQNHLWGYNEKRLMDLFENLPVNAEFAPPQDYHSAEGPCLRIEVTKI